MLVHPTKIARPLAPESPGVGAGVGLLVVTGAIWIWNWGWSSSLAGAKLLELVLRKGLKKFGVRVGVGAG